MEPTLFIDRPIVLTTEDVNKLEGIADRGIPHAGELLDAMLQRAHIVDSKAIPPDVVTMLSRVLCTVQGIQREWMLVYPESANLELNRLSVLCPAGQALLGARAGETVSFVLPDGRTQVMEVLAVVYQPEAHAAAVH